VFVLVGFANPVKKANLVLGVEPGHGFDEFLSEKAFIMTHSPKDYDLVFQHGEVSLFIQ
jgi:hypothetical protein